MEKIVLNIEDGQYSFYGRPLSEKQVTLFDPTRRGRAILYATRDLDWGTRDPETVAYILALELEPRIYDVAEFMNWWELGKHFEAILRTRDPDDRLHCHPLLHHVVGMLREGSANEAGLNDAYEYILKVLRNGPVYAEEPKEAEPDHFADFKNEAILNPSDVLPTI